MENLGKNTFAMYDKLKEMQQKEAPPDLPLFNLFISTHSDYLDSIQHCHEHAIKMNNQIATEAADQARNNIDKNEDYQAAVKGISQYLSGQGK